ncbi:MAG: recombinase family protein, partial [Oscillospiraceae bacterium]|nr:recombinase family protein [Oscillospiraceae bacterium]
EMKKPTITKEGLVLWLNQIQTMRLEAKEHKQRLIDIFVNAVYLYDDKLVITFNYKEATKTVNLKEVNGSIIECAGVPKKRGRSPSLFWYAGRDSAKSVRRTE